MTNKIQATTAVSASTETKVYEVPTGYVFTGFVNVCNRNSTVAKVRIAYGSNAAMAAGMYVEYDLPLSPAGTVGNVVQLTGVILGSEQAVWVRSDSSNVDVVVGGYEE